MVKRSIVRRQNMMKPFKRELLIVLIALVGLTGSTNVSDSLCTLPCECSADARLARNTISAHCKVQRLEDLVRFIVEPANVTSLDLSGNSLYTIQPLTFVKFTELQNLNLSYNSIAVIAKNAFRGLHALRTLDLSHNKIKYWEDSDVYSQLSSLQTIKLSHNPPWFPPADLLKASSLQKITGLTWTNHCTQCSLVKNMKTNETMKYSKGQYGEYIVWHCRGIEYSVTKETQTFAKYGFYPECFSTNRKCYESQIKGTKTHRCWDTDNLILYVEYLIGLASIILNVTVVTVTLTSPLNKNIAMLLVANLAFSDCLNGIYSVSITLGRQVSTYTSFLTYLDELCLVLGFLWVLAQSSTILTSVLLTIERYVTIIFSMKPHLKPTATIAKYCICISWIIGIVIAVLPLVGIGSYVTNTYCVPIQPSKLVPGSFMYSVGLSIAGVILYLLTVPLYIKIFVFVRHSSQQMGVKRDAKIAGRILILVLTNMVFFLTPIIIGLLWLVTDLFKKGITIQARNVLVSVLPTVCFSLNGFLNPLLYAFRNYRFRQTLRFKLHRLVVQRTTTVADISMKTRSIGSS